MRGLKLDYVNVVDVEATCWEGSPPVGQHNDIIQIGLSGVDIGGNAHGHIKATAYRWVTPTTSLISDYCESVVKIDTDDKPGDLLLAIKHNGIRFADACQWLSHTMGARRRVWASWGEYDRSQFIRQCTRERVEYPFGSYHLNVKAMFAVLSGHNRTCGVEEALSIIGLKFDGVPHNGAHDAHNIARILSWMLKRFKGLPV